MPAIDKAHILKVNGFSHGLNFQQIASYIIILAQILLFSFFVVPNFVAPIKISFSILYYISTAIVIISGFKATVIDPTDEIVFLERRCRLEGKPFDEKQYPYQCEFCETSVHDDSKHCRACNRCVNDFDHHCNWINNCISRKNYKEFLTAIISLAISTSLFLTVGILFLVDYYTASLGVLNDVTIIKGNVHEKWKPILMAVFSGIAGIFCVLLLKLINFHIYLMKNKISTYEYIIRQRDIETRKQNARKTKQSKERKVTPVLIQSRKNSSEIKKSDLEKKETLEAKDRKEEESESEEESDEEDAEESFGPQKGDRVVNAYNYTSVQSGLSSHRDSKALLFARDPSHNRITIGGETERVDKLIRASSCTDIDIEQNLSGLTTPNEKLIRKRNSDLSPDVIISIKQDQNAYKSPRLKNLRVPSALSPFDSALHIKSRHDTSTEGALTFSSRTLSLTMIGQNSKLRPAFSTPKGNSEYGIFLKTESNLPVSPIGGHETDRQRLKTVSIVELDRLDIQTKQTSNVSQAPVTFATEQNF